MILSFLRVSSIARNRSKAPKIPAKAIALLGHRNSVTASRAVVTASQAMTRCRIVRVWGWALGEGATPRYFLGRRS